MRTEFTKQTMRLAWARCGKRCEGLRPNGERCDANLEHKPKHFDHAIPDAIGGTNDLSNCQVLCVPCHKDKTAKRDVPVIAKAKRNYDNYNGIPSRAPKMQSRGFNAVSPQSTASRPVRKWYGIGGER